jgi:hypothetical protein
MTFVNIENLEHQNKNKEFNVLVKKSKNYSLKEIIQEYRARNTKKKKAQCLRVSFVHCTTNSSRARRMGATQLAARDTKERARLGWPFFCRKKILKTMIFRDVRTALNERKHLKGVTRSAPDSII